MKKKLLFVLPSLKSGGAEKSLVTLLQTLDYTRYDVDLLLFRREGLFLPLVPPQVRVLDAGEEYRVFDGAAGGAVRYFIRHGKFLTALRRVLYALAQRQPDDRRVRKSWRYLSPLLPRLRGYDAAIGYLEGTSTYYVADKTGAKRKLSFLHTDYDRIAYQHATDEIYYRKIDTLVGVSDVCVQKAEAAFPFLRGRTAVLHNLLSPDVLQQMALSPCELTRPDCPVLLTVGRMSLPKGIDLAVQACGELLRRGVRVRWVHIGTGELRAQIEAQIRTAGLQEDFILLGERSNPYPYVRFCDVYVQPSRFEGKSIAVDEAKALQKPIVVTDFGTVRDQIADGVNGLVAAQTPQALADAVTRLLHDDALRDALVRNLTAERIGNTEEIERFYAMI